MSAIATKKPYSDRNLMLTYPAEFQKAYAMRGIQNKYFPSLEGTFDLLVGDNSHEQDRYHEEKRKEANQTVMNAIQARKTAERKLLTGPHNYHLPKPVLSQRRFANPSLGATSFTSARRDNSDAPFRTVEVGNEMEGSGMLRGGVRTNEGYAFYRGQLNSRIGQLDRLDALAQGYAVKMGQDYRTDTMGEESSQDKMILFTNLKLMKNAIIEGNYGSSLLSGASRFLTDSVNSLIKTASIENELSEDDYDNMIKQYFNPILETVYYYLRSDDGRPSRNDKRDKTSIELIFNIVNGMKDFAETVGSPYGMSLQKRDRKTLIKSLTKELGFNRLMKESFGEFEREAKEDILNEPIDFDEDVYTVDGTEQIYDYRNLKSNMFYNTAKSREDLEHQNTLRNPLAGKSGDPQREQFGKKDGASWFGETQVQTGDSDEPRVALPLDMAGFDPNAEMPSIEADISPVTEALDTVIKATLEPLMTDTDSGKSTDEIVANHYPQKKQFVNEVESAMKERGFSEQEIARAMEMRGDDVFSQYVGENSGSTAPKAISPAYRYNPATNINAPVYDPAMKAAVGVDQQSGATDTGTTPKLSLLERYMAYRG